MSARTRRLAVPGLAVLSPVLVWLVADPMLGRRLEIANGDETLEIGAVVALVALLTSLAGWGLLAALERFGVRRARAVWTGVAVAVLALSFLPLTGDMAGGTRAALAKIHLAVAAVLIPGLRTKDGAAATRSPGPYAPGPYAPGP